MAVPRVRDGEASVALHGDFDPVAGRLVEVRDERFGGVVIGARIDREMELPEIQQPGRVANGLPRRPRAAFLRAVVHDRDARPQRMDDGRRP